MSPQQILTTVITHIVVDKGTDPNKPHFDLFFTTISMSKKFFFRAHFEKSIAHCFPVKVTGNKSSVCICITVDKIINKRIISKQMK